MKINENAYFLLCVCVCVQRTNYSSGRKTKLIEPNYVNLFSMSTLCRIQKNNGLAFCFRVSPNLYLYRYYTQYSP